jgi:hypothetical protein
MVSPAGAENLKMNTMKVRAIPVPNRADSQIDQEKGLFMGSYAFGIGFLNQWRRIRIQEIGSGIRRHELAW